VVENLVSVNSAQAIQRHLEAQPGIVEARFLGWNESSKRAVFVVFLQPAARTNLLGHLQRVPTVSIRVRRDMGQDVEGVSPF